MKNINNNSESHSSAVREAVTKFLVPLQTDRVIKQEAFNELLGAINAAAQSMKGCDFVSKSLLNEIYVSVRVLRNEKPFFQRESVMIEKMANQLETIFELILRNESPGDRVPGVPRII